MRVSSTISTAASGAWKPASRSTGAAAPSSPSSRERRTGSVETTFCGSCTVNVEPSP